MKRVDYKTVERWPSDHLHPHYNIVVKYGRGEIELENGSGSTDDVYVYREGDEFYVLCVNPGLPYVGLEIFNFHDVNSEGYIKQPRGEVFGQEGQVYDLLGPSGTDLAPATMVRRLSEYIY